MQVTLINTANKK